MTKLITIPLSEHKQLLAKVSNLETQLEQLRLQHQTILSQYQDKYNQLLAENTVLQERVLSLKQQLFGKKKDKINNLILFN